MTICKVTTRAISYDRPMTATRPAATRPAATLTLIAQLSKSAIRKTPETLLGIPLRHYAALAYIAAQEGMAQQTLSEILCMDANNLVLLLNELEDEVLGALSAAERDELHRLLAKAAAKH